MNLRGGKYQTAGGVWMVETAEEVNRLLAVLADVSEPVGLDLEYSIPPLAKPKNKKSRRHVLDHSLATCITLAYPNPRLGRHPTGAVLHQRVFIPLFESDELLQLLKPWLESDKPKVGHNIISADAHVLLNHGIKLGGIAADTLRKSRMGFNSKHVKHGLKPVMERVLGYQVQQLAAIDTRPGINKPTVYKKTQYRKAPKSSPLYGTGTKVLYGEGEVANISWSPKKRRVIPHAELWRDYPQRRMEFIDYATLDAKATAELNHPLDEQLRKLPAPNGTTNVELYNNAWQPYCELVAGLEVAGIALDTEQCSRGAAEAWDDVQNHEAELEQYEPGVNWGSPDQLKEVLYRTWNLPRPPIKGTVKAIKASKPDEWNTSEAALHWLELNCPEYRIELGLIRKRRKARRLYGYLRDLPAFLHLDGRLHTILAPSTDTGRLASSCPPLQQIPNAKSDKYGIRRAFVAGPGRTLIVADYSQLEVYVLAHFLITLGRREGWPQYDSLATGLATGDVYSEIAKLCWPVALATASAKATLVPGGGGITYRDLAKIVVLAENYGKTEQGMAVSLLDETGASVGLDFAVATKAAYAAALPALEYWARYIGDFARANGGVPTILGRWRPIPECRSDARWERSAGERKARNTPIQGSAADIVAMAGLGLLRHPRLMALGAVQVLHVHDEIVIEVPIEHAAEALELVIYIMEHPPGITMSVPLKVEAKIAPCWAEGK